MVAIWYVSVCATLRCVTMGDGETRQRDILLFLLDVSNDDDDDEVKLVVADVFYDVV